MQFKQISDAEIQEITAKMWSPVAEESFEAYREEAIVAIVYGNRLGQENSFVRFYAAVDPFSSEPEERFSLVSVLNCASAGEIQKFCFSFKLAWAEGRSTGRAEATRQTISEYNKLFPRRK
jgi:hypothetical protein